MRFGTDILTGSGTKLQKCLGSINFINIATCKFLKINVHAQSTVIFCSNVCFHGRPSDFLQSIQGQTNHGYINNDILVGLFSELLTRLSYYIH